jgi:hypothetical protein
VTVCASLRLCACAAARVPASVVDAKQADVIAKSEEARRRQQEREAARLAAAAVATPQGVHTVCVCVCVCCLTGACAQPTLGTAETAARRGTSIPTAPAVPPPAVRPLPPAPALRTHT